MIFTAPQSRHTRVGGYPQHQLRINIGGFPIMLGMTDIKTSLET
jgi:hypothetical protein